MNDCEKKGCSACGRGSNPDGLPCIEGQASHPEVTDVKNRELLLFLLVLAIMVVIAIAGAVVFNRSSGDDSLDNPHAKSTSPPSSLATM